MPLFDPNKVYSQEEISEFFALAPAFVPVLRGSLGEVRRLDVCLPHSGSTEPVTFALAIKRMHTSNDRNDEVLQEATRHLDMYRELRRLDEQTEQKGGASGQLRCASLFTEPFAFKPPTKRGSDGHHFVYTLQAWAVQRGESVLEFKSVLNPRSHAFLTESELRQLNFLTSAQIESWLKLAAAAIGRAVRCLFGIGLVLDDLHSGNVLLCFRGALTDPQQVRIVMVDMGGIRKATPTELDSVERREPPGTGVLTHLDVRLGSKSAPFFDQFVTWLKEAFAPLSRS